MLLDSAAQ
jgi:hypothetical protein